MDVHFVVQDNVRKESSKTTNLDKIYTSRLLYTPDSFLFSINTSLKRLLCNC